MKLYDDLGIIPEQFKGEEIKTISAVSFKNKTEAISFYKVAKNRLLNVNDWHSIAGFVSGRFYAVNQRGEDLDRMVKKDDYLKIDIPGPGSSKGEGFDWVHVEELKEINSENFQSIGFRVRPTHHPKGEKDNTAHFYSKDATSTFIVSRKNLEVIVEIFDLNLTVNEERESVIDSIRNAVVGVGAIGLFSKVQWKNLADGIVKTDND